MTSLAARPPRRAQCKRVSPRRRNSASVSSTTGSIAFGKASISISTIQVRTGRSIRDRIGTFLSDYRNRQSIPAIAPSSSTGGGDRAAQWTVRPFSCFTSASNKEGNQCADAMASGCALLLRHRKNGEPGIPSIWISRDRSLNSLCPILAESSSAAMIQWPGAQRMMVQPACPMSMRPVTGSISSAGPFDPATPSHSTFKRCTSAQTLAVPPCGAPFARLVGEGACFVRQEGKVSSPPFREVTLANGAPLEGPEFQSSPSVNVRSGCRPRPGSRQSNPYRRRKRTNAEQHQQ